MSKIIFICATVIILNSCVSGKKEPGSTVITKWPQDKKGAVSITYDDGSINQFRKAIPIMNRLSMPGTFFINTGSIPGSEYQGKFIGRPVREIISETRAVHTNQDNFFERASAAGFLGLQGTLDYHTRAGSAYDAGRVDEAYKLMDELYAKVRNGEFKPQSVARSPQNSERITWDEIRVFASQGHEFASHMVTHPYMAALDEPNIIYELEKSREEILDKLGPQYTFSAECPYGTENERVMEYAHKYYPALRNRMPETFLEELNRSNKENPGSFDKEYVQWQRGATTKTPLPMMKSWIDTTAANDNIWLVLVIHGVDGIGWEALTSDDLDDYFGYIKFKEEQLWVATFGDAAKYIRERMNASVNTNVEGENIVINVTHTLDTTMYNLPLGMKTYVPSKWKEVNVRQGTRNMQMQSLQDEDGTYVIYEAIPDGTNVLLTRI